MRIDARHALALALGCSLACRFLEQPTPPTVVLDGWWDGDYAAEGCSHAGRMGDEPRIAHCAATDVRAEVRDFENRLATSFATDTTCGGVRFMRFEQGNRDKAVADAMARPHWWLSLNFEPGAAKQPWAMTHKPEPTQFTKGEGAPEDIAHKVCAIVNGRGATLAN